MENKEEKIKEIAQLVKQGQVRSFQDLLEKTKMTKEEIHKLFIPENIIEYNNMKRAIRKNENKEIDEQR